ncbi:MAG: Hpt domain-containing protein [Lachnospiraceae bacterium]|nr:Hpt domain-containing protein [Lachnospiraceae bacterium]
MASIREYMPPYVDADIGMRNCGDDEEQYREAVRIVCRHGDEKKTQLLKLMQERDYERFLTEIHALKNNFATVGAMALANRARAIEDRCKSGKRDGVIEDGFVLADDYGAFIEDLKKTVKQIDKEEGLVAGDEEIARSFEEIKACVLDERFDDASDLFEVLAFFNLPDKTEAFVDEMRRSLLEEDKDGVLHALKKLQTGGLT